MAEITGTLEADIIGSSEDIDESLRSTDDADIIFGQEGDDTIDGAGGDDLIQGDEGNDTIDGGDGDDLILGGEGDDDLSGGAGNDIISGGVDDDEINGGDGTDIAAFGSPATYLEGGESANVFEIATADGGFTVSVVDAAVGGDLSDALPDFFTVVDSGDDTLAGIETIRFGNNVDLDLTADGLDLSDVAPELVNSTFDATPTFDDDDVTVAVDPGATFTLTSSQLDVVDPDTEDGDITYTVTSLPTGALSLDGTALAEGGTFTQADIESGLVSYAAPADAADGTLDAFEFSVTSGAYSIEFDAVGDEPTFTFAIGGEIAPEDPVVTEGQTFSVTAGAAAGTVVGTVAASDPDGGDIASFAITDGNTDVDGDGTAAFAIDDDGQITVLDADDLVANQSFTLAIEVTDDEDATGTGDVVVNVGDVGGEFSLDVDQNGSAEAFTDGLIIFRALAGLAPSTFESALAADAGLTDVDQIAADIQAGVDGGFLDVDQNGSAAAFTDGLIVFRFLAGLAPSTFESALAPDAGLTDVDQIAANLDALVPA